MKIVLFGAGSAQFGYGMLGDLFSTKAVRGAEIVLVDINGEALQVVQRTADDLIAKKNLDFHVWSTTDARKALPGADFVIISIEVGNRFALWEEDWNIPLRYGVRQIYGENGGAGGVFHALRIIPPIMKICEQVQELAPVAFVFCYSNPMTAITAAITRALPDVKFIGVCHEIASVPRYIPDILGVPMEKLSIRAAGLNHFSVIVEAAYRDTGKDAYPDLLERGREFFAQEPGFSEILEHVRRTGEIPHTEGSADRLSPEVEQIRAWSDRWLFKRFMDWFHLMPITVDSHMGEYVPWTFDVADHRGIQDFYAFYKQALSKVEPKIGDVIHELAGYMIAGIVENSGYEEPAVNILNDNLIPDLPAWLPVEVPARVTSSGFEGIRFPHYPKGFGALLRNYVGVYDMIAEAVIHSSREYALQALLVNPVVTEASRLESLLDTVISSQRQWLSYLQ